MPELIVTKFDILNSVQRNWKTPSQFPLCPQSKDNITITSYFTKLRFGVIFTQNKYNSTIIEDFAIPNDGNTLCVLGINSDKEAIKPWSIVKIAIEKDLYIHESLGGYFKRDGAEKYFIIAQGKEWSGGDDHDDFV